MVLFLLLLTIHENRGAAFPNPIGFTKLSVSK
jgi:hypothetical protein